MIDLSKPNIYDDDLILDRREKKLLKKLLKMRMIGNDHPITQQATFKRLVSYGLIVSSSDEFFGPTQTADLNRPIFNCYKPNADTEQFIRRTKIEDWKEYRAWVTLGIAILALILSLIALVHDLGMF